MTDVKGFSYALVAMILLCANTANAEQIVADKNIRFIDGNHLVIKGKTITLYGIRVRELGAPCDTTRKKYDCGLIARSSLMDMSAGAKIVCNQAPTPHDRSKYKCLSNGYDLSEGMVYTGWAKPLSSAPTLFKKLAQEAKDKHRGMWRISAKK